MKENIGQRHRPKTKNLRSPCLVLHGAQNAHCSATAACLPIKYVPVSGPLGAVVLCGRPQNILKTWSRLELLIIISYVCILNLWFEGNFHISHLIRNTIACPKRCLFTEEEADSARLYNCQRHRPGGSEMGPGLPAPRLGPLLSYMLLQMTEKSFKICTG